MFRAVRTVLNIFELLVKRSVLEMFTPLKFVLKILAGSRFTTYILLILLILSAVITVFSVTLVGSLIDSTVSDTGGLDYRALVTFLVFLLVTQVSAFVRSIAFSMAIEGFIFNTNQKILMGILESDPSFFEGNKGSVTNLQSAGLTRLASFLKADVQNIVYMPILSIVTFIALIYINAVVASLIVPIIVISSAFSTYRKSRASSTVKQIRTAQKELLVFERDGLDGGEYIMAASAERFIAVQHEKKLAVREGLYSKLTWEKMVSYRPALISEYLPTIALIILAGMVFGPQNQGEFAAVILLVGMVSLPFSKILRGYLNFYALEGIIVEIDEFCEASGESVISMEESPINYDCILRVIGLGFGYSDTECLFEGVDFELTSGEKVAIMGRSGIGKSTFVKILLGFYKPSKGSVTIFGRDSFAGRENTWGKTAYFGSNTNLFSDTLAYNITLLDRSLTETEEQKVLSIASKLGILDIVNKSTLYDQIAQFGDSLSGGQKLKICLARVILRDAELLVLDEPSANLDAEGECIFRDFVRNTKKTVLLITHNPTLAEVCDRTFNFEGKAVV